MDIVEDSDQEESDESGGWGGSDSYGCLSSSSRISDRGECVRVCVCACFVCYRE
jgi:hypothetical protein